MADILRRRSLAVALAVLVITGVGIGVRARWPRERDYVGGTAPATLTIRYACLNDTLWTDPATDVSWWVGEEAVLPSDLGMEWRLPDKPRTDFDLSRGGHVSFGVANGTIRFDTRERATFTGSGGGTMPLFRRDGGPRNADCDPWEPSIPFAPTPGRVGFEPPLNVAVVTDERHEDGSHTLISAKIQVHEGAALVHDVVAPRGLARLLLPSTVLTASAEAPGRTCPTVTVSVDRTTGEPDPSFVRLTCPPA